MLKKASCVPPPSTSARPTTARQQRHHRRDPGDSPRTRQSRPTLTRPRHPAPATGAFRRASPCPPASPVSVSPATATLALGSNPSDSESHSSAQKAPRRRPGASVVSTARARQRHGSVDLSYHPTRTRSPSSLRGDSLIVKPEASPAAAPDRKRRRIHSPDPHHPDRISVERSGQDVKYNTSSSPPSSLGLLTDHPAPDPVINSDADVL